MEKETGKNKTSIKNIYIHITKLCNLNCRYCYFNAGKAMKKELHFNELLSLFKEIILIRPKKVVFTGGEPLLRKDIFNLINDFRKMLYGKKINLCLMSNGVLIDNKIALRIVELFDEVRISIDGPPEVNDILRGNGSFRSAVNAIKNLKNAGISPAVSITMTSLNLPILKDFLSFLLDELFITSFHLSILKPSGRNLDHPELKCSWGKASEIVGDFWQSRFGEAKAFKDSGKYTLASCGNCGIGGYINILPDGSVYPCHVLSVPKFCLGNIRKTDLSKIIFESDILRFLKSINFTELAKSNNYLDNELKNNICPGEILQKEPDLSFYS